MMEEMEKIKTLFKKMLKDFEEVSKKDQVYRKDIEEIGKLKIQWRICGILGYQVFDLDNYSYGFNERLEDPDIIFTWREPKEAIRFLNGEYFEKFGTLKQYKYGDNEKPHRNYVKQYKHIYRYRYTIGWKIVNHGKGESKTPIWKVVMSARFKKGKGYHPFIITKLPMFRDNLFLKEWKKDSKQFGAYIPINQSLGRFENEILPVKVFKHFFEKASNIVALNHCACRVHGDCQEHAHDIGCIHLGDDTLKMIISEARGRVISSDEALAILKRAIDNGLIPLLGRARGEPMGFGVEETGHFMSMCFCCPCCCVDAKILTHGSVGIVDHSIFKRMDGVNVLVDKDLCVGCGICVEECKFRGMELVDGIAEVNQARCLGCGRCEHVCPNGAISITIDDESRVNEIIAKLESYVDVAPQ